MTEAIELANARIFKHMGHRGETQGSSKCICGADMRSEAGQRLCPKAEYIHIDVHRSEIKTLVSSFGTMKNGAKIRRKVNQIYGRQIDDLAQNAKRELDAEIARRLANFNSMAKEKPRYIPTIVWKILLDIVLKNDTIV